jgi:O-acetyl-ADP-ribose deacetylase (regulator of RNase III)
MIEEGSGNLLTADVEALINTVNTVGVMGKGIALQFKRAYPANYKAYRLACERGEVRMGKMYVFDTATKGPRRYLINFPTKQHWKNVSRLDDIASGLSDLVRVVNDHGIRSVAIPALGCGNGGLDWGQVRPLIEAAAERMPKTRVLIFAPTGAPSPASMPNATPKPTLNSLRALLMVAVQRYLDRASVQEAREGVSELEIQKLAYFLQVFGAHLRLTFKPGPYGPYADQLTHVLDSLEGHYLSGLGDRSARVTDLAPINLTFGSLAEAQTMVEADRASVDRLEALLRVVDGFETPYSMELLATVHFAAHQNPATSDLSDLSERVAHWSMRKARLFTDDHVRTAARRLADYQLLPV